MTVQEWLGSENKLGIDIWERKYRKNGETFDQWIERVSGGNREIARMILEKKLLLSFVEFYHFHFCFYLK